MPLQPPASHLETQWQIKKAVRSLSWLGEGRRNVTLNRDIDMVEEIHRDMLPAREESHSLGVHI